LRQLTQNPNTASTKLDALGSGQQIDVNDTTPQYFADIYASFDKDKNVVNIDLNWKLMPVINATDRILQSNQVFDPRAGVTATDALGNDATNRIVITENNVNTKVPGIYHVTYEINSDGMTVDKRIQVTVNK